MITQQQGMVHVEIALGSRILLQCNSTSQAEVYGERVVLHNFIQWYKVGSVNRSDSCRLYHKQSINPTKIYSVSAKKTLVSGYFGAFIHDYAL